MSKILAASIGSCVHVAGTINFLTIAEKLGYESYFNQEYKFQIYRIFYL